MKTFNIDRPFEVIKGLRDGELSQLRQLRTSGSVARIFFYVQQLDLHGIIQFDRQTGDITANKDALKLFSLLDVSLSQLEGFESESSLVVNPIFRTLSNWKTVAKTSTADVFVLMPFSKELLPTYQDHIRPTIEALGLSCARADDFFSTGSIMDEIWHAILSAKAIIADCTGRNPNVFYEIGLAHTIGKPVVLIAQSLDDIPFDLRHRRIIVYEYTPRGMKDFDQSLRTAISLALPSTGGLWV